MCTLALALTLGSTLIGAAGQIQSANAQAAASNYNAKVQEMNASISERRARDAIERGEIEQMQKRREVGRIMGQQQAAMAANGVDMTFGSPLNTLVDTAVLGEMDTLQIRRNSYNEAYDYRVEAANQRAGATLSRMNASAAKTSGWLNAAGTVLGGASNAYGQYSTSYSTPSRIGTLY